MGIRPHPHLNHLGEVGESDPCSAPLHSRRKGALPPAKCPLPPASWLKMWSTGQYLSKIFRTLSTGWGVMVQMKENQPQMFGQLVAEAKAIA
ncbi:hypothetical protein [Nostoc flagelliforme]|uniref:hypothetical protein n=1 Tax=Nostoc flagelliforme TaxID=1306274 RepID=UPI00142D7FC4|nr:hypothetical protein [Nostoc flagelliforme]